MDYTTKFDRRLEMMNGLGVPARIKDAAIDVNDTLELAWFSAQGIFGKAAKPEHALAIYDRMKAEQQRLLDADGKDAANGE